jgi:4-amino-4-deoxy-L-arabinose transferase-like glycosyltransferase
MLKKKQIIVSLVLIIIFGFFLRFYKLSQYPVQLGHDEVTQLYDAISILRTGKDIYGVRLPFIFQSVNDFKPPFYTYATLILLLLFGWQDITIKIVGAFLGVVAIPAVYFFTYKLLNDRKKALLAAFLTTIAPFEIFYSRKSFENGAGVTALLIGFGLLLGFIKNQEKKWQFFLGSMILSLGMYTYFSHAVLMPILYGAFLFIFRKKIRKLPVFGIVVAILIAFPLIWFIFRDPNSANRSKAVFITQDPLLGEIIGKKVSENDSFYELKKDIVIAKYSFIRYLNQLDPYFLFGNGLDLTNQDPVDIGPLYFFQLPFLILGFWYLFKEKNTIYEKRFILAWILIGLIPSGITFEEHSPHRIIMVFTMLDIISAYGLYNFYIQIVSKQRSYTLKSMIVGILGAAFIWNIGYFAYIYTITYPFDKSQYLQYPYKEIALYAWSQRDNYQKIVFDPKFGEDVPFIGTGVQYYFGYYGHFPPELMQKEFRIGDQAKRETLFDKFSIRAVNWNEDKNEKYNLIIASPWSLTKDALKESRILATFYFYDGREAYYALSPNP